MKATAIASPSPVLRSSSSVFCPVALTVIVTLLAALAIPRARAEEPKPAPAPDQAAVATNSTELPAVNRLVYLPQLPTPASLQQEAAEQGTTILRLDRTDDSVVVIYKYADGRTENVGYTILSPESTTEEKAVVAAPPPPPPAPRITVVSEPPPTVVYREAAPVYYGRRYYYDPIDDFWAPLALGIGIGYISHGHGTYYHGRGGFSYGRGHSFHRGGGRR